ncbi:TspO/MBR family protein [Pontibacter sp. G13]|uniref:TspO/MBR family protein n=1 Tax=Pontibacter sp. G13 TaxID=3074898 RepID=UPI002889FFA0|nr:TspO/MBR family protein [Pontibacter sp. G13]WNJ20269.1 TspO/MBR family protein [Pontibacter sp. G13]
MLVRFLLFLVLNFAALGIGGFFTGQGVPSDWYQSLDKAPWTPPGWVFGAAWTTVMLTFSAYMAVAWDRFESRNLILGLYLLQWVLNVAWNPVFFQMHWVGIGLVVITALALLVWYLLLAHAEEMGLHRFWVLPYVMWLTIATSLNAYIWMNN